MTADSAVGTAESFEAGLEVRLAEGWHAYWRMPGEGGLAPAFDWSGSGNVETVEVSWPVPKRFNDFGLYSFGYEHQVIFPLTVRPGSRDLPVNLALTADIMVCRDVCVPQQVKLSLTVPAGEGEPGRYSRILAQNRKNLPLQTDTSALKIESVVAGPDALVVRVWSQHGAENLELFVEAGEDIYLAAPPEITPDAEDRRYATLRVAKPESTGNLAALLMNREIILTLVSGKTAIERRIAL